MKAWLTSLVIALSFQTSSTCAVMTNSPQWTVWKPWNAPAKSANYVRRRGKYIYSRDVPKAVIMAERTMGVGTGFKIRAACNIRNIAR